MKTLEVGAIALVAALVVCAMLTVPVRPAAQAGGSQPTRMSAAEFATLFKANTNWGRWGPQDRLGTINLITDAKRRQAAALVRSGTTVSVAHDLSEIREADNGSPIKRERSGSGSGVVKADTLTLPYHGTFTTHQDSLCHYTFMGQGYNGGPAADECVEGIDNFRDGIVTRGILIDIPRLRGVPYLEPDAAIFQTELEAWERRTGLKVSPGDAVIVRTGRWARRKEKGPWNAFATAAGLDVTVAPWFKARDVAIAGADVTLEVHTAPPVVEGQTAPLHTILIAGLGMPIIDDLDPEALAEMCARLGRWEFMLVVAPLRVPNGTGSPVNPIAIF